MRKSVIAGAALPCLCLFAATPAASQTLVEAYKAALSADPDQAAAAADRDAAEAGVDIGRSLFRPKARVQASAGYSYIETGGNQVAGVPRSMNGAGGNALLLAEQPILNGEASAQRRQLAAGARAGRAQYDATRQQLALRVVQAYFDVLRAQQALTTVEAQVASAVREQRAATARFDAGRAQITDVREAQAQGDAGAAQAIGGRTQLALAGARFRALTGLEPAGLPRPPADLAGSSPALSLAEAKSAAVAAAPMLVARKEQANAARANADRYRWSNQVKLSAQGIAGHFRAGGNQAPLLGIGNIPDRVTTGYAGLQLDMPLFTGGGLSAQRRQADAQARAADAQTLAARRDVELRVEQAWLGQTAAVSRIGATRAALASARLQERAAQTGREVGTRTQTDVLAAQTRTFEAERQVLEAVLDYEYNRAALAAESGSLDEAMLSAIDRDLRRADKAEGRVALIE